MIIVLKSLVEFKQTLFYQVYFKKTKINIMLPINASGCSNILYIYEKN